MNNPNSPSDSKFDVFVDGPTSCNPNADGVIETLPAKDSVTHAFGPIEGETLGKADRVLVQTDFSQAEIRMAALLPPTGEPVSATYTTEDATKVANAIADLANIAQVIRGFADSIDTVINSIGANREPAETNVTATPAPTGPKLTRLEASVLGVLKRAKGKFVPSRVIRNKISAKAIYANGGYSGDVTSAVRRIRNKTGLLIQAARTTRKVTGEVPKTEVGYRLIQSV